MQNTRHHLPPNQHFLRRRTYTYNIDWRITNSYQQQYHLSTSLVSFQKGVKYTIFHRMHLQEFISKFSTEQKQQYMYSVPLLLSSLRDRVIFCQYIMGRFVRDLDDLSLPLQQTLQSFPFAGRRWKILLLLCSYLIIDCHSKECHILSR